MNGRDDTISINPYLDQPHANAKARWAELA